MKIDEESREKIEKWKCDICGKISYEERSPLLRPNGEPMPDSGWGCNENDCRGEMKLVKEDLNPEQIIKKINGLVGAFDGRTLDRVKRILFYLTNYQWAVQELSNICELSDREMAIKKKNEVMDKLKECIDDINIKMKFEVKYDR